MKKCAQCGSDFPSSNEACPKCGYDGNQGYFFGQAQAAQGNTASKVIIIVVIVMAIMIILVASFIFTTVRKVNDDIRDNVNDNFNNFSITLEECKTNCDGNYMYVNGICSCTNINFE